VENVDLLFKTWQLSKSYRELQVLDSISIEMVRKDSIAVVGPSGCGKTTLLRLISGLEAPTQGCVERYYDKLGYVFQEDRLIPWRTVVENLLFVTTDKGKVEKILKMVGLADFSNYYPSHLSGGMRQRVNLARALVKSPDLVLLDEPFQSLDLGTKIELIGDVNRLKDTLQFGCVLVTHDIREAVSMSRLIYVLSSRPARVLKKFDLGLKSRDFFDPVFLEIEKELSSLSNTGG